MGMTGSKSKKPRIDDSYYREIEKQRPAQQSSEGRDGSHDFHNSPSSKFQSSSQRKEEPVFVLKRAGSMYLDEDGNMAHEFYEEVVPTEPGQKPYMKRVQRENLKPQGDVFYSTPRLSGDCDIILWDPS